MCTKHAQSNILMCKIVVFFFLSPALICLKKLNVSIISYWCFFSFKVDNWQNTHEKFSTGYGNATVDFEDDFKPIRSKTPDDSGCYSGERGRTIEVRHCHKLCLHIAAGLITAWQLIRLLRGHTHWFYPSKICLLTPCTPSLVTILVGNRFTYKCRLKYALHWITTASLTTKKAHSRLFWWWRQVNWVHWPFAWCGTHLCILCICHFGHFGRHFLCV